MKHLSSLVLTGVLLAPTAQAADWNGPYAGITGGSASGLQHELYDNGEFDGYLDYDLSGSTYGVFAGFNHQSGSYIFGIEAAYSAGAVETTGIESDLDDFIFYDAEFTSFLDLKARAGFANGPALFYGFAGYSSGTLQYLLDGEPGDTTWQPAGWNYGAGVDYMVSDNAFIGIEYIVRNLSDDLAEIDDWIVDSAVIDAIQVRAGMTF